MVRKFTKDQYKRLANILDNLGQVILAAIALPALLGQSINVPLASSGLVITFILWWLSLKLERLSSQ